MSNLSKKGPDPALSVKQVIIRIAVIVLMVNVMILGLFSIVPAFMDLRLQSLLVAITSVVSSVPLIYVWVIKPFNTAHENKISKITHMAHYDPLTELPNRRLLSKSLEKSLPGDEGQRAHGALIFIDLDDLKSVNDKYGHEAGDKVLVETAKRLRSITRSADIVSRIGGDEFVLMIQGLSSEENKAYKQAETVAKQLQKSLNKPTVFENTKLQVSSSIGIRLLDSDKLDGVDAIRDADDAMYRAKHAGGDRIVFFAEADAQRKRAS